MEDTKTPREYYIELVGDDIDFEDSYQGEWDSFTEFVYELISDIHPTIKDLVWYITIDWADTAHNIRQDYMVSETPHGSVHVFENI